MIRLIKETDKNNVYGADFIDILQFNFDGEGSALVKEKIDNDWLIGSYGKNDINAIFGLDESPLCYRLEII